jgi:hypothetical protein
LGFARINPRLVKIHFSYTLDEIGSLLGVHKNTVRAWVKAGLTKIDASRPALVQGRDLRTFLEARRNASKRTCPPGTLFCLKCREPKPPAFDMLDCILVNAMSGNLRGLCPTCGTLMHRRVQIERLDVIMPGRTIQFVRVDPHLRECTYPSLNCHSGADRNGPSKVQRG